MTHNKLPFVFLDVSIDGDPAERMIFELFDDVVPKTAKNFRALCTGENGIGSITGKPMHYKGCIFHRIMKGFFAQGGDFSHRDGSGGESIYGEKFEDESFSLKHDGPGYLSMFNTGPNSNGSQFFITFKAAHHLDGLNVVFGKLVKGRGTLKKMEGAGTEQGKPEFLVKIVNCGELLEGKKKKSKRSSKARKRKKRRRYSSSESESSSDTDTDSSDSDSDSDSDSSSSSDVSSSSDDRRKKRKRSYKKDKYKRSKRRRDRRREKKRKRRDKKSRRKSKRAQESSSDTESGSTSGSRSDNDQMGAPALPQPPPVLKSKHSSQASEENQSPLVIGKHAPAALSKNGVASDVVEQDREPPRENGNLRSNGVETETPRSNKSTERKPDLVNDDLPGKSRSPSISPKKAMSKSMSISPPRRHGPRSLTPRSISRSPERVPRQSRSISRSPERAKSISSRSSRSRSRSIVSRSPSPRRGPSRVSRSPVKSVSRRSGSRSSLRSARRKSPVSRSPSPVKRKRSISRSPVRKSLRRRSVTRSPVRRRRSYSRSPISPPPVRKGRSSPIPSSRGRSVSRSVSPDGSPKRVRRGRGFSYRYSYARRYRTPTPDRSLRYGGRTDRSYRSYADRSSRNYRSPPRGRTPPSRYKSRRSWSRSRSASRSPPIRSRRSPVEKSRSRGSLKSEKRGRSVSASRSRSPVSDVKSLSRSPSPKLTTKEVSSSRSVSASPVGKGGLVSYGDGSPDSGQR
ncbi:peptidylprolyl isomerase [Ranunculus cassubicifolius]